MIKVGLVFLISIFFTNKIALANIWMSFSCSNIALCISIVLLNNQGNMYLVNRSNNVNCEEYHKSGFVGSESYLKNHVI